MKLQNNFSELKPENTITFLSNCNKESSFILLKALFLKLRFKKVFRTRKVKFLSPLQPLEVHDLEGLVGIQAASRRNDIPYHLSTQSRGLAYLSEFYPIKLL
jgi:hypothetical protein